MSNPVVSVCCLTYNHESYIREALDGFLMQNTNFKYEILVHDDASTDGTADIIREYQKQYPELIKPMFQDVNQYSKGVRGMNVRFNFPRASGKYLALCEGDDYWTDPFKLQKQVDFLRANPDLSFCCHAVNRVDTKGNIINEAEGGLSLRYFTPNEIIQETFRPLSLVFRGVALDYSNHPKGVFNGDVVLFATLSSYGGAAHLDFVGGNYRIHAGGVYSSVDYLENAIKSILTRRVLIESGGMLNWQIEAIKKNIRKRKIRALRHCLKTLNIKFFIKILFL